MASPRDPWRSTCFRAPSSSRPRQIEQTETVISILIGRPPAPAPRGRRLGAEIVVAAVPAGLPSRLLEQRPDVRQAETQLAAATVRIGVAKADYFPGVFLTGAIGVGGLLLNRQTFGPQGLFSILPSATVPIFNSERVSAGVAAARARAEAAAPSRTFRLRSPSTASAARPARSRKRSRWPRVRRHGSRTHATPAA